MRVAEGQWARLQFLARVTQKECQYLLETDRAEKLGWLLSADTWLEIRKLRNQMVDEYIEDPVILSSALMAGHGYVPVLVDTAKRLVEQIDKLAGAQRS